MDTGMVYSLDMPDVRRVTCTAESRLLHNTTADSCIVYLLRVVALHDSHAAFSTTLCNNSRQSTAPVLASGKTKDVM